MRGLASRLQILLPALAAWRILLAACTCTAAGPVGIAVLIGADQAPYEQALAGFHAFLGAQGVKADYDVYALHGNRDKAASAVRQAVERKVAAIFALGSAATEEAAKSGAGIPVVSCMVLRREFLEVLPNTTGVVLEFPVRVQMERLHALLPKAAVVGVVYNRVENRQRIRQAAEAARSLGLRLEAYAVERPSDLPAGLQSISNRADVLWGVPDRMVLAPETARNILLFSMRNRIPLIGLSPAWVKAGALYSLEWDYEDMGRQCGEMLSRVLQGESVKAMEPVPPRRVLYSINGKTAARMKVEIPDPVIRAARSVY